MLPLASLESPPSRSEGTYVKVVAVHSPIVQGDGHRMGCLPSLDALDVGEMMKWWELFPTRHTSNMLFRPWVRREKKPVRAREAKALSLAGRSRAAGAGADEVLGPE